MTNVTCPMCGYKMTAEEGERVIECPCCLSTVTVDSERRQSPAPTVAPTRQYEAGTLSRTRLPSCYNGSLPYVFVSYAHKNFDTAMRIIDGLNKMGLYVWYDAGIEAGTEWPDYIANKILGAECFLSLMSYDTVKSRNCTNEIEYALKKNKKMLIAYIDGVELEGGLDMMLNPIQAIYKTRFADEGEFIYELGSARVLAGCRH